MEKILISRCLLGHKVRYDGGASGPFDQLAAWQAEGRVVAICPEVAGGLPTPRPPAEIPGGQGVDVWEGLCGSGLATWAFRSDLRAGPGLPQPRPVPIR